MASSDFIRVHMMVGTVNIALEALPELAWPPPEYIYSTADGRFEPMTRAEIDDCGRQKLEFVLKRMTMSALSDEDMEQLPNIARGAEYRYLKNRT